MVPDSRAPSCADALRPLNEPQPITVLLQNDRPVAIVEHGQRRPIAQIKDTWSIDDEWWRGQIARRYYIVLLESGSVRTIYHDLIDDGWFRQAY